MTHTVLQDARHIRVDTEHFAIRFSVPVVAIGLTILAHLVGMSVFGRVLGDNLDPACVVVPLDVGVFLGLAYGVERLLKRVMPSRRSAVLTGEALTITDGRKRPPKVTSVHWDRAVNVLAWRFVVKRRTRVPKGWSCMAVQLLQDEDAVILYTFMPPDQAEKVAGYDRFVRLRPRRETESNTDLRAVAEQRRLLKLEDQRWEDGAEIAREDFAALLFMVEQRVSGWR